MPIQSKVAEVIRNHQQDLAEAWQQELQSSGQDGRIGSQELETQTAELLRLISEASLDGLTPASAAWAPVRQLLEEVSTARAVQGFTSEETATFVFALKKPLFESVRRALAHTPLELAEATWEANALVDQLGIHTVTAYQRSREAVIRRQQEELLELSTPVVKLWDGVLALPMIGTLDSSRTQVVMESLLGRIVETGAEVAIIDITGVPTVDTLVAQHLLKTVTAIRLMGADCIISGIRPQIAQTIVHLGVELRGVTTKATLADALNVALDRRGLKVVAKDA
ncbi:MAG: STAS domain-containing protein [Acidobacteriota bacterium]